MQLDLVIKFLVLLTMAMQIAAANSGQGTNSNARHGWQEGQRQRHNAARQEQVDAIIMGRRGRGRLAGLLLGSVPQKVASLALVS